MDPQAVEMGQDFSRTVVTKEEVQEVEARVKEEVEEEEGEDEESPDPAISAALQVQACYREYFRSGLYPGLPFGSLQSQSQLLHAIRQRHADPHEETQGVIQFVAQAGDQKSDAPLLHSRRSSSSESTLSSRPSKRSPRSSSPFSVAPSHSGQTWRSPKREAEDCEQDAEPLNLSSGSRESSLTSDRRSHEASGSASKSKKPKGLEIANPSVVLTGSDLGSIALNSPALPSGSLTPALFTAQVGLYVCMSHENPGLD